MEILTSNYFQLEPPYFSTINYLKDNFTEHFETSKSKFDRVVFELFNGALIGPNSLKDMMIITYNRLSISPIDVNLSIFMTCKNGQSIINTRSNT